jgi:hypothetical protein
VSTAFDSYAAEARDRAERFRADVRAMREAGRREGERMDRMWREDTVRRVYEARDLLREARRPPVRAWNGTGWATMDAIARDAQRYGTN